MSHYRTNDGQGLFAETPADIVKELHKLSFSPSANDQAFMHDTQGRVKMAYNKRIRCNSAENFVSDLLEIGLLIREEDEAAA